MEPLRDISLKKIEAKFSQLMKQKSICISPISSLFSLAKSHYQDEDYVSTFTDFTTLISKFPDGALILANSSIFTNSILNDKKLFDFYLKNPDKLPRKDKSVISIKDYIAGMTDHFLIKEYSKI